VALARITQIEDVKNAMKGPGPKARGTAASRPIATAAPDQPSQAGSAPYRRMAAAAALSAHRES
jgi:hypothetical protein